MLNETSNDEFYWRDKLDKLENLPGENFNKEVAWNKLHQRLHKKSSAKKFAWYWVAAAILLLILAIPFLTYHKKESAIAKKDALTITRQQIDKPSLTNDKIYVVKIINVTSSKKKNSTVNRNSVQRNSTVTNKDLESKFRISDTVSTQLSSVELPNALQPIDTLKKNIVLITQPQKKKLKVVHINELGEADEEQPTTVRSTDTHAFQLRFANQEVFVNHSNSKATGFVILKTKNSTN